MRLQWTRKPRAVALTSVLSLLAMTGGDRDAYAQGAVPSDVSYQGLLWLADGSVAADGSYDLEFSVWDVVEGGSDALWTQPHPGVEVRHGVFDVVLEDADGSLAAALDGGPRYMETRIVTGGGIGGTVLEPRQRIGAAAWALVAERAAEATSLASAPPAPEPAVPSGLILLWAEGNQCPPGFEPMNGGSVEGGAALDLRGRFPLGATPGSVEPLQPDVGQVGGSEKHVHTGTTTDNTNTGEPYPLSFTPYSGSASIKASRHGHTHAFLFEESSHVPFFGTVLFCRKL